MRYSHQLSTLTQADEVPDDKEQSNAPHPAALTKPLQKLVDEIRSFGRSPKCIMGASADDRYEYNLYQRYYRHKDKLPEDLLQEDDKADALDIFCLIFSFCLIVCYCHCVNHLHLYIHILVHT